MENLQATYQDEEDDEVASPKITQNNTQTLIGCSSNLPTQIKHEPLLSQDLSDFHNHQENQNLGKIEPKDSPNITKNDENVTEIDGDDEEENHPIKKQKKLSSFTSKTETLGMGEVVVVTTPPRPTSETIPTPVTVNSNSTTSVKNSKKKGSSKSKKPISRKGKKKPKSNGNGNTHVTEKDDLVRITPLPRFPDKSDDTPEMKICLSKMFKAEKVELSEDRLSAGSGKGYRMVRSTRGVSEGAWYFEIKLLKMGVTGHTRLGWSTEKGDLQAPVGYDGNSFGYRDIDGSKIHKALREKYGEGGYEEGDIIGFYINLPEGNLYTPKPTNVVRYKGQKYTCPPEFKEDPPKVIPGSEISFFKNGICQGVAFKDLYGGRYYPAASMYTLPNQPNCVVRFNFGPDFKSFPGDFGDRPLPRPMIEVPYHGFDSNFENGKPLVSPRMFPMLNSVKEQDTIIVED